MLPCKFSIVKEMVEKHHGYKAIGSASFCFAVYEDDVPVAAFSWLPPPPQTAKSVCPEAPFAVLGLSRMVAVPKAERKLKHISKPLMKQMKQLLDRTRWPVLVTFSDESQGHNGYVYQCSGWEKTTSRIAKVFEDEHGARQSKYSNGSINNRVDLKLTGMKFIQRWEHWVCPRGMALDHLTKNGWERCLLPGKFYTSGNQAYKFKRTN